MNKVQQLTYQPGGARVIRNMVTDDEYSRMITAQAVMAAGIQPDAISARRYVDEAMRSPSTVMFDKGTLADIQDYARKLGPQGANYIAVMETINKIDPSIAEDKYKDIYKLFKSNIDERNGVKIDTTYGQATHEKALNPEIASSLEDEKFVNKPTTKIYLKNNVVIAKDDFGGTVEIKRVDDVVDAADAIEMKRQAEERKQEKEDLNAPVGSIERIKAGAKASFVNSIRKMADEVSSGFRAVKDFFGSFFSDDDKESKELSANATEKIKLVDSVIKEYVTELPEDFDKLSPTDQRKVKQAIEKNKASVKLLEQLKEKIRKGED
jgi:hypothetical protein